MVLADMVTEVKASLGNRTDLTDQRYLSWLNWAYYDVCGFHKKRIFGPKMFRFLEGRTSFQTYIGWGICSAGGNNTARFVIGSGAPSVPVGEGWEIEVAAYNQGNISGVVATGGYAISGSGFLPTITAGYRLWSPQDYRTYKVLSVTSSTITVDQPFISTGTQQFYYYSFATVPTGLLGQQASVVSAIQNTATDFTATVLVDQGSTDTVPPNQWFCKPDASTIFVLRRKYYYIGIDIPLSLNIGMTASPQFSSLTMWALDSIYYLQNGEELDHLSKEMLAFSSNTTTGSPKQFYRHDNMIVFDVTPDNQYQLEVLYYAYPRIINYDTNGVWNTLSYDIPDYWHEIIIKGAVWRGHDKLMEPDRAAQALSEYENIMLERFDSEHVEGKQVRHSVRMNFFKNGSYTVGNDSRSGRSQYDRSDFLDK